MPPIREGFESGTLGIFTSSGSPGWSAVTQPFTGTYAAFAPDVGNTSDQRLTLSAPIAVPLNATSARLQFMHRYDLDIAGTTPYDGAVLEISTDGGFTWTDAPFITGWYNGRLTYCPSENPLAGRYTWVGNSNGWGFAEVDLMGFRAQSVLLRFRLGSDQAVAGVGWWIDDIVVSLKQSLCWTATVTSTPSMTPTPSQTLTPTQTVTPCSMHFTDVPPSEYFYEAVHYLYCAGIVSGYADNTFRPYNSITRGQIAKVVSQAVGYSDDVTGRRSYADVPSDHTFWTWIERLTVHKAIGGYACGGPGEPCDDQNRPYFRPFNGVTRGQAAKIAANTFYPGCQTP